jgi:hypothetical protein
MMIVPSSTVPSRIVLPLSDSPRYCGAKTIHRTKTHRRRPSSFAFGNDRLDRGKERRPRCDRIEVAQVLDAAEEVVLGTHLRSGRETCVSITNPM